MNIKITPSKLTGYIDAIASKSYAHRYLICAALADKPTEIAINGFSDDIDATISCLQALGCDITVNESSVTVSPLNDSIAEHPVLDCRESGSTLRFMLPVAAALCKKVAFKARGRLPERPLGPLLDNLKLHGVAYSWSWPLVLERDNITAGVYEISGSISSQFISGLLFALPLLNGDSIIRLSSPMQSTGYVRMTLSVLSRFGIKVEFNGTEFFIKGNQRYTSPETVCTEGDWSNGAFWLAAGALGDGICCNGLDTASHQGDREVLSLLKRFGASVSETPCGIKAVLDGKLSAIEIDAAEIPDLIPIISVVAAAANGETVIYNPERLRLKQSDRLNAIFNMLSALGADVELHGDVLHIRGRKPLTGGTVDGVGDHRIVMSASIASMLCTGNVTVIGAEAVSKSYPNFFKDFEKLGGKVNVE